MQGNGNHHTLMGIKTNEAFWENNWGVLIKIKNIHSLSSSPVLLLGIHLKGTLIFKYKNACIVYNREKLEKKGNVSYKGVIK